MHQDLFVHATYLLLICALETAVYEMMAARTPNLASCKLPFTTFWPVPHTHTTHTYNITHTIHTHNTYVSTHTTHAHTQHAYTLTHTHNTYVHTHTTHTHSTHTHRHTHTQHTHTHTDTQTQHTHYISRAKQVVSLSEIAHICMYHRTLMTHTPHLWCSTPVKSNLSGYHYLMATYIW